MGSWDYSIGPFGSISPAAKIQEQQAKGFLVGSLAVDIVAKEDGTPTAGIPPSRLPASLWIGSSSSSSGGNLKRDVRLPGVMRYAVCVLPNIIWPGSERQSLFQRQDTSSPSPQDHFTSHLALDELDSHLEYPRPRVSRPA